MFRMLTGSSADLVNGVVVIVYLGLLLVVYLFELRPLQLAALGIMGTGGIYGWLTTYKLYRLVADTPTSRIEAAAQGYIELSGTAQTYPDSPPLGFRFAPPCVWYRYCVYRNAGGNWTLVSRDQSSDTFLLADNTGQCIVDPDGAEVITRHHRSWTSAEYRHLVDFLLPGEPLYVIGSLTSRSNAMLFQSTHEDVRDLLAEWKRDPGFLRSQFDRNRDGKIDQAEWEEVRKAAEKHVEALHQELGYQQVLNIIHAPEDSSRPFIIADRDPEGLARQFHRWSWSHAGAAVLAAGVALYIGT